MQTYTNRFFSCGRLMPAFFAVWMICSSCIADGRQPKSVADAQNGATPVKAGQGIMAGEVTADSALVQLRLTATDAAVDGDVLGVAGVAKLTLMADGELAPLAVKTVRAEPETDYVVRVQFSDLAPDTNYRCTTRIGSSEQTLQEGPALSFKTLPGREHSTAVKFVVVTGMNYNRFHGTEQGAAAGQKKARKHPKTKKPYSGPDKHLGYPALETILKLKPDFFVGTGDNVYYDTPKKPRAETVAEMRQKWHEQFVQPRFRDLFAAVPTFWMVDDHDFRIDDCDNSGDYLPSPDAAKNTLLEQLPFGPAGAVDTKTYRTVRVNKALQVWFPENRFFRSANKMPDGPEKTIWGTEQKEWLKKTLVSSDAQFKILVSPTPMVGPDDLRKKDNHCNVGGFRHERDEFFTFLSENGLDQQNFFVVCGDRHWQYHAIDPSGVEEFSCGALVDANSRLGRNPGDPASTDPNGLIKQPYTQKESSGGFLMIRCESTDDTDSAALKFEFFDEKGVLLHACAK